MTIKSIMKSFVFISILFLFHSSLSSNEYPKQICNYTMGEYSSGSDIHIFAENAIIRKLPSVKSDKIISLSAGSIVHIISKSPETHTINGYSENWYHITAVAPDKKKTEGYIWGGLLSKVSLQSVIQSKTFLLMIGILSAGNNDEMNAEARIVSNGTIVSRITFSLIYLPITQDGSYRYTMSGAFIGEQGFNPEIQIFSIKMDYPAGQFPYGEILFYWNGKDIKYLLEARLSGYEGNGSGYSFIFPHDKNGIENQLIVNYTIFSHDGNDMSEKEYYLWNGNIFKKK